MLEMHSSLVGNMIDFDEDIKNLMHAVVCINN